MSDDRLLESLAAALDELGQGVAVVDIESRRYVSVNEALADMFGQSKDEMLARTLDHDLQATQARRADGSLIDIEVSVQPLSGEDGTHLVLIRDITERLRRERAIVQAEQRYRTLVERLPVVTYVAEPGENGRWIYVSPQIERMFGYSAQEWIDDPTLWARLVHPDDQERVFAAEARLVKGERLPATEYRMYTRAGDLIWVDDDAVLRAEPEDGVWYLDGLFADITERKVAEARLQHLADHDALTGLLNRRRFIEDLTLELALIRRSQRDSSVVVVDVDNFKDVNDSLGHHAGDQLIRSVATLLAAQLREADTIARLGGDEFAILLRGTTGAPALVVAERLIEAVREHRFAVADDPVRATASGGIATVELGQSAAEECLAAADLAMYESKQTGRDRLTAFSPQLRTALEQRRSWADRIRDALEHD